MSDPRAGTYVGLGFAYGLVLTVCGVGLLSGGHGTGLPLLVFSCPLGLVGIPLGLAGPYLALVGPIPLWTLLTALLVWSRPRGWGWQIGLPVLAVHYGSILLLLHLFPDGAQWERVVRVWTVVPGKVIVSAVVYGLGQMGFWTLSLMPYRRTSPKIDRVWRD